MFNRIAILLASISVVLMSGCATIVHSGPRSVPVASTPPGAKVTVYDSSDAIILTQTTPFVAELSTKQKYFQGRSYRMVFQMDGYAPAEVKLEPKLSGWYFGNLLFGGLIGMLIVDPLTGAMYNLTPEKIEQPLSAQQAQMIHNGNAVMVVLASQALPNELANMVRVN